MSTRVLSGDLGRGVFTRGPRGMSRIIDHLASRTSSNVRSERFSVSATEDVKLVIGALRSSSIVRSVILSVRRIFVVLFRRSGTIGVVSDKSRT